MFEFYGSFMGVDLLCIGYFREISWVFMEVSWDFMGSQRLHGMQQLPPGGCEEPRHCGFKVLMLAFLLPWKDSRFSGRPCTNMGVSINGGTPSHHPF